MNRKAFPDRYPRIEGLSRVSWHFPFPPPLTSRWREHIRYIHEQHLEPAVRVFYTPNRHMSTNVAECVRLFQHYEKAVQHYQEEYLKMAKENNRIAVLRWVNYRLSEEDKDALQAEPVALGTILADFGSLVYMGYRLSVSYDDYSKAMQASLVCVDKDSPDSGMGISARHPDLDWCLRSLLFKVHAVGIGKWNENADSPSPDSWS